MMDAAAPASMMLLLVPIFILGLIQLICFVLVVAQMFQRGETGMGIACVVLFFCTGIGGLLAFIYGWVKSSQWGLQKIMLTWTGCFVLNLVLAVVAAVMGLFAIPMNVQQAPVAGALLN